MATAEAAVVVPPEQRRPGFTAAAVVGLLVAASAPLWILVPEGLDAVPLLAPFLLVPLAVAVAVWRDVAWSRPLGFVTGLGLLAAVAPQAVEGLSHPDSFFDFFPVASMIVGALLAAVGSVLSARLRWRGGPVRHLRGGERAVVVTSTVLLLVLGVGSGVLTAAGQHTVSAVQRYATEPVTMAGFEFVPATLRADAGSLVRYVVRNDDLALHTVTIDELGVDVVVKPRSEALVEFSAGKPGVYTLYCRPHTQDGQGMVATFTVE